MTRDTRSHIGHLAGVVYRRLEREGRPVSVLDIAYKENMWPWDVMMAVGWLSCEDKILLHRHVAALMVELR